MWILFNLKKKKRIRWPRQKMSSWKPIPGVTDLLCALSLCLGWYLQFFSCWGLHTSSAPVQEDLKNWPLPCPEPLQVVIIKTWLAAGQRTMLMTAWLQGGKSSSHLARGRWSQEADVSLTWPTGLGRNLLSDRPGHSWVLWGMFLSLVAGCYRVLSSVEL